MHPANGLLTAVLASLPLAGMAACDVESGPETTALVELYTSEGCSSCPPADARLSGLRPGPRQVPLALHVGYWDDLGWRDPFAQQAFANRQSWLVGLGGARTVYTPQFFVSGVSTRPAALAGRIDLINAEPAGAQIRLRAALSDDGRLAIGAWAASPQDDALLYAMVAESGLSSDISAGENRGRRLRHDHVVRAWLGPFPLEAGRLSLSRTLALAPSWRPQDLEVGAFVQDPRSGRVLQTVGADRCLTNQEIGS